MPQKRKIINDPVFGFVNIPDEFIYELIRHPYLQRLSRIKQLGMASFVYPGAQHTRFHHTIGAMYLMDVALRNLRDKGHEISKEEYRGALAAILMHDIGHAPFSHVLENRLAEDVHHEEISLLLMQKINEEKKGALATAIEIFNDTYSKKFLHQLVSGQLDVDRLDYLQRDSFFTGVSEGNIGAARIMKMLDVIDDKLVVESKGIYSIENFLMSRRFMYWQVYLHKTAVASEIMLRNTLNRAKFLSRQGKEIFASPALQFFLQQEITLDDFFRNPQTVKHYIDLDDNDIWTSLKVWKSHPDKVLSILSNGMVNRNLFKIQITNAPQPKAKKQEFIDKFRQKYGISEEEAGYFVSSDSLATDMYNQYDESIKILFRDGTIRDISTASDMFNIELLSKKVEKYYLAYLRD